MTATITYSNEGGVMPYPAFASGSVAGDHTEDALVYCGFQPSKIVLFVHDTNDESANYIVTWTAGMTVGKYQKISVAGVLTLEASGGPTVIAESPTETTGAGFTIPAALILDASTAVYYEAWR